ncbi:MAG: CPBP family intramembrane metalloprotease, partial [Proteobacteria bacterium]|nr:CPBP family intramembrane metalloprotease [Pseudomonadota bacterium]
SARIDQTFQQYGYGPITHALMLVLPLVFLLLCKKDIRNYGFNFHNLGDQAKTGLNLFPFVFLPMVPTLWISYETWYGATLISLSYIPVFILIVRMLQKGNFRWISGIRRLILVPLTMFLLMLFLKYPHPTLKSAFFIFIYFFFFVGFGEEFMFRGYIQTRLNIAFGKPYTLFGTTWGPGMIISAVIFGLMHTLNAGFNPFQHNYHLSFWWGVFTMAGGFVFGYIREKTASIIPVGIIHGLGVAFPNIFFNI